MGEMRSMLCAHPPWAIASSTPAAYLGAELTRVWREDYGSVISAIRWPLIVLIAAAAAVLLMPAPAAAQVLYGSITGTVTDPQKAAMPGVTVTATNTGTTVAVEPSRTPTGNYTFRNLPPGTYDLTAVLEGFRELRQTRARRDGRQHRPRRPDAADRPAGRDGQRHRREHAAADGEVRSQHGDLVQGGHEHAAEPVPELPDAAEPGVRARRPRSTRTPSSTRRRARCARGSTARSRTPTRRASTAPCRSTSGCRTTRCTSSRPSRLTRSTSRPTTSTPTRAWRPARRRPSSPSRARTR